MAIPEPRQGAIALVTGASSGIGTEIARGLARRGHALALVARRRDRLEELAAELDVRTEVIVCDIADPPSRDALAARIDELGVDVEVLCNNAGFGTYDDFAKLDRERELDQVRTNVEGVVDLTGRFLPGMVGRGQGAILNTASTSAFQPIPGNATYAATKAFVLSFSEALHTEVASGGITVTALCPGPVKTEFQDVGDAHEFADRLPKQMWVSAADVAEAGLAGLERHARVVTPGVGNRVSGVLSRATPNAVLLRVLRSAGPSYRPGEPQRRPGLGRVVEFFDPHGREAQRRRDPGRVVEVFPDEQAYDEAARGRLWEVSVEREDPYAR